jgi:hypothetical protein
LGEIFCSGRRRWNKFIHCRRLPCKTAEEIVRKL